MDVEFTPLVELKYFFIYLSIRFHHLLTVFLILFMFSFQTSRQNLVDPMLNIWAQQQTSVNEDSVK
jgi:hypothetical protein